MSFSLFRKEREHRVEDRGTGEFRREADQYPTDRKKQQAADDKQCVIRKDLLLFL
jgi:hypothetical protein